MHSDILMYLETPSNSQVLLCLQGLHRLFQCICNSIHGHCGRTCARGSCLTLLETIGGVLILGLILNADIFIR